MAYARTYSGMWLCSLTAEQRDRGCGYWYTVTTYGATPHTAFKTREALQRWLDLTGLRATIEIPPHGEHSCSRLEGAYREELHLYDADQFHKIEGIRTRELQNGDYVEAIYSTDPYDGLRTCHKLNPNVKGRRVFPYHESEAMIARGEV